MWIGSELKKIGSLNIINSRGYKSEEKLRFRIFQRRWCHQAFSWLCKIYTNISQNLGHLSLKQINLFIDKRNWIWLGTAKTLTNLWAWLVYKNWGARYRDRFFWVTLGLTSIWNRFSVLCYKQLLLRKWIFFQFIAFPNSHINIE